MSTDERRERSRARLAAQGVQVVEAAGLAARGGAAQLPGVEHALLRAMVLAVTGLVGDGLDLESAAIDLERWALRPLLAPEEAAFLAEASPSAEQSAAYSYRQEGMLAILWALGLVPELEALDPDALGAETWKLLSAPSLEVLTSRARYRPTSELLDALDYYGLYLETYRAAVPPGTAIGLERQLGPLSLNAVSERLGALAWLTGAPAQR